MCDIAVKLPTTRPSKAFRIARFIIQTRMNPGLRDSVNLNKDTLKTSHRKICLFAAVPDPPYAARGFIKLIGGHFATIHLIDVDQNARNFDSCFRSRHTEQNILNRNPSKGTAVLASDRVCQMIQSETVDHRSFHEKCLSLSESKPKYFDLRLFTCLSDFRYALHL